MKIFEIRFLSNNGHWSCQTLGGDIEHFSTSETDTCFKIHYKDGRIEEYCNYQYVLVWREV